MARVEHHPGELFPRDNFIVTNLSLFIVTNLGLPSRSTASFELTEACFRAAKSLRVSGWGCTIVLAGD